MKPWEGNCPCDAVDCGPLTMDGDGFCWSCRWIYHCNEGREHPGPPRMTYDMTLG